MLVLGIDLGGTSVELGICDAVGTVATRYCRGWARNAFEAAARIDADALTVVDWACDGRRALEETSP